MKDKKKLAAVLLGIVDVLLIAAFAFTFFVGGTGGGKAKANLDSKFQSNAEGYGDVDETKEYKIEKQITYDGKSINGEKVDAQTMDIKAELVFPDSDKTLITDEQMNEKLKDKQTLRLAINEIYARHGYAFTTEEYINHFNQFDWYKNMEKESDMNKVSASFSETEKTNVEKLQAYSDSKGWS